MRWFEVKWLGRSALLSAAAIAAMCGSAQSQDDARPKEPPRPADRRPDDPPPRPRDDAKPPPRENPDRYGFPVTTVMKLRHRTGRAPQCEVAVKPVASLPLKTERNVTMDTEMLRRTGACVTGQ